ncbi:MAG TPA: DUF2283 domain-containing protein [Candidatus Sulfotelmatobacter sp.]|nr:DUF2283 domain-containing protein [Candidatus Sulfotelmatobacter sp.]
MKVHYDPRADALYIRFQEGLAGRTRKVEDGVLVDLDEAGRLYGIEIIGMKGRIPIPELGKIILAFPSPAAKPAPA